MRGGVARIDLGLALLSVLRKPGERLTLEDIAAWCDCPHQTIGRIEQRALRKLREGFAREAQRLELAEAVVRLPVTPHLRHAA